MFKAFKSLITGTDRTGHRKGSFATPTAAENVLRTLSEISSELHTRTRTLSDALRATDVHIPSTVPEALSSLAEEYLEWEKCGPLVTNGTFNEVDMRCQDAWTKARLDAYQKQVRATLLLTNLQSTDAAFSRVLQPESTTESVREIMQNVQHALSEIQSRLKLIDVWASEVIDIVD